MLTAEQIAARKGKIGGSDAAVAVGQSPRMTARALYHVLRGEMDYPEPDNPMLLWLGHQVEPILHNWFVEQTGWKLENVRRTRTSKRYPWAVAHIDRRVLKQNRIAEFKMRATREGWGPEESDDVPTDILIQCLHYLALYEKVDACDVVCFFRLQGDIGRWIVPRDPEYIDQLMTAEQIFMERVAAGKPPEWDFDHPTTLALMKQVYPGTDGRTVDLPETALTWWDAIEDARKQRALFDAAISAGKARILSLLGTASLGRCPDGETIAQKRNAKNALSLTKRRHLEYQ